MEYSLNLTYPFQEIASIWICIECFVVSYRGFDLSDNLFSISIIYRYGSYLKSRKTSKISKMRISYFFIFSADI